MVIHVTHRLHWALGHSFEDVHKVLRTMHARWVVISARTDKPQHSHWLDYSGDPSGAILES